MKYPMSYSVPKKSAAQRARLRQQRVVRHGDHSRLMPVVVKSS